MSKRRGPRAKRRERPGRTARSPVVANVESRASVALTVGWMLCLLATLLGVVLLLLARGLGALFGGSAEEPDLLAVLPQLLLLTSLVTGTLCLLLTVAIRWVRVQPAPWVISAAAVVVGLVPWLLWAGLRW
ncbi:MAG: hypothetical protein J5I93_03150 [Pirellulaceae bacterium]|nr:hypothetical protein [Pirellulaceae bacterium]